MDVIKWQAKHIAIRITTTTKEWDKKKQKLWNDKWTHFSNKHVQHKIEYVLGKEIYW